MLKIIKILLVVIIMMPIINSSAFVNNDSKQENNISGISVKDMEGNLIPLSSYKGKVLLIVNVASECGFTPQYKGLQAIYEKYNKQGFEILAFPCNDFGGQEPGSNEEIKNFCKTNFNVSFKLFDKIKVLGDKKNELYKMLTNYSGDTGEVKWNFEKFLIDKNGNIIKRFRSRVEPESPEITAAIKKELSRKIKK